MNAEYIDGFYVFKTSHLSKYAIVVPYTPGDINNDGTINNKDVTRLFQYVSGWKVDI